MPSEKHKAVNIMLKMMPTIIVYYQTQLLTKLARAME